MAKYELKEKAQKLRKEGFPINQIKDKLKLSKSTVIGVEILFLLRHNIKR
jgi:orotate phosphoribosyltransferase-like protein